MSHYYHERGWLDSEVWGDTPYDERSAWSWMIGEAAFETVQKSVMGFPLTLERGQLTASLRFMGEKWNWSGKGAKDKVRRFLDKLTRWGMISSATDRATGQTIITICKYEVYQDKSRASATERATATRHPRDRDATPPRQTIKPSKPSNITSSLHSEVGEGEQRPAEDVFVLPDWIPVEPWNGYMQVRAKNKWPATARALNLLVGALQKLNDAGHDPTECIDLATMNGWRSFYEPKRKENSNGNSSNGQSSAASRQFDAFLHVGQLRESHGPSV